jgi:hypothetical protein
MRCVWYVVLVVVVVVVVPPWWRVLGELDDRDGRWIGDAGRWATLAYPQRPRAPALP